MTYAIFTRRRRGVPRVMHAVREGERQTICHMAIGLGTGLVADGDYWNNKPCSICWHSAYKSTR